MAKVPRVKEYTLEELVVNAITHAELNQYDFSGWSYRQIATDMCTYDAFLGAHKVSDVEAIVRNHYEAAKK